MDTFNQILLEAIKLALAGIAGGLIGARANDKLTRQREKDSGISSRKREFLAFMAMWKTEIAGNYAHNTFRTVYAVRVPEFKRQASLISGDFTDTRKTRFDGLIDTASSFKSAQMENEKTPEKKEILDALDAIVRFVG